MSALVTKVGFIGVGSVGGAIASRIIGAGFATVLWARRPEALVPFAAPNVEAADDPASLAAAADLVGICVWADEDVRDVVLRPDGVLAGVRPGTVIAVHSTARPSTCRELAAAAAGKGATLLDAPFSGSREVALAGELVVGVGGDTEAIERCRPVFASFADLVLHLGPVGSAQSAKLVNNALLAANLALADDALSLGEALGMAPGVLAEFLRRGSGRSYALDVALTSRQSAEIRRMALAPLEKDVDCLLSEAPGATALAAPLLKGASAEALERLARPLPEAR